MFPFSLNIMFHILAVFTINTISDLIGEQPHREIKWESVKTLSINQTRCKKSKL